MTTRPLVPGYVRRALARLTRRWTPMTDLTTDNLRTALARIRPGDEVTVRLEYGGHEGTISGEVWERFGDLCVAGMLLLCAKDGGPGVWVREVLSHTPAPPPSATVADLDAAGVYAVATDDDGELWVKDEDGLWHFGSTDANARSLINAYGPITLRTDGVQA